MLTTLILAGFSMLFIEISQPELTVVLLEQLPQKNLGVTQIDQIE